MSASLTLLSFILSLLRGNNDIHIIFVNNMLLAVQEVSICPITWTDLSGKI